MTPFLITQTFLIYFQLTWFRFWFLLSLFVYPSASWLYAVFDAVSSGFTSPLSSPALLLMYFPTKPLMFTCSNLMFLAFLHISVTVMLAILILPLFCCCLCFTCIGEIQSCCLKFHFLYVQRVMLRFIGQPFIIMRLIGIVFVLISRIFDRRTYFIFCCSG